MKSTVMEQLIIAWDPEQSSCDWMLLDHNGNRQGPVNRDCPLEGLPVDGGNRPALWLMPGIYARAVSAHIPARGRDKILRALPFALEESFASDPEALFFALPANLQGPQQKAVAVERALLEKGLATLQEQGLKVQHIVPDYLALPWQQGQWTVLADADMLYVRHGMAAGFTMESNLGWQMLGEQLEASGEEDRPEIVRYMRGREPYGSVPRLDILQADPEPYAEGLLGVVPQGLAAPPAIDLRQGPYSLRKEWLPQLRPWFPAAASLGLVILLGLTAFGASWYQASRTRDALAHKIRTRYQQILPHSGWQGESTARDVIEGKLNNRGNSTSHTGFLDLLNSVAQATRDNSSIRIKSMNYQNGQLELHVHAPTVAALDDLRSKLGKAGAQTTVRSANQTSSGVEGSLMLNNGGQAQ
ncbi:MAG TPA: type II secretion system protein GspL [Gammaproteobacteria bacterium]|nr:type II secretion system protein GspL [Gammaproteobacteria bacterium]